MTPAFLGNAEQQGQWRTPPFKALLRQWWRVADAARCDVAELAKAEGELFGVASDEKGGGSRRSRVQIRLSSWRKGTMNSLPQARPVQVGRQQLNPLSYLGYGVVDRQRIVHDCAIGPDEEAALELRFPPGALETTLELVQWFGTLGGRSRNGWGSLDLEARDGTPALRPLARESLEVLDGIVQPWEECLTCEWPHAIGRDEKGPLVWVGSQRRTWQDALSDLAVAKKAFRGALPLDLRSRGLQRRHLLAYPVTKHEVSAWGMNGRLVFCSHRKIPKRG